MLKKLQRFNSNQQVVQICKEAGENFEQYCNSQDFQRLIIDKNLTPKSVALNI